MTNLVDDISVLTTIPKFTLQSLVSKCELCISHSVFESMNEMETTTIIDIGIGTLILGNENDEIKYKFIPSRSLEKKIVDTVTTGESSLTMKMEDTLRNKIMNAYKDLF